MPVLAEFLTKFTAVSNCVMMHVDWNRLPSPIGGACEPKLAFGTYGFSDFSKKVFKYCVIC